MQILAVKTFNNNKKLGLVRAGMVITVDERYGLQLIRRKLAKPFNPAVPVAPPQNASLPGPDKVKEEGDEGNGAGDDDSDETLSQQSPESGSTESSSVVRRGGGRRAQSSSQRPARASRKKT